MNVKEKKSKLEFYKKQRASKKYMNDELFLSKLNKKIESLEIQIQDDINHYKEKLRNTRKY